MLLLILAFAASLLPSILLYLWFRKFRKDDWYKSGCTKAFIYGVVIVVPVLLMSLVFNILEKQLLRGASAVAIAAFHNFVVLALAEELVKYFAARKVIKKVLSKVSWLDVIVIMGIVGIAFGVAEDIPYAIGSNPIMMLIRGATVSHGVYGMITGWFLGKIMKGGRKAGLAAILVSWLYHGLYDFGLSEEALAVSDLMVFVPVLLAIGEAVILIFFIFFIRKARRNEKYTAPLFPEPADDLTCQAVTQAD